MARDDQFDLASLDWTKLRVVTHLRHFAAAAVDNINKALISLGFLDETVNSYSEHPNDLRRLSYFMTRIDFEVGV